MGGGWLTYVLLEISVFIESGDPFGSWGLGRCGVLKIIKKKCSKLTCLNKALGRERGLKTLDIVPTQTWKVIHPGNIASGF